MSENEDKDRSELWRNKVVDLAAFLILLIFILALIMGMIDHSYQLPLALQGLVGLVGTYFFGQRLARWRNGASSNEEQKNSGGGQLPGDLNNSRNPDHVGRGRTEDSPPGTISRRVEDSRNPDDSVQSWHDADDDN